MHDSHMSCQCIVPAENLLFRAQVAAYLLFAIVVDRVFVSCEIVAAAETLVLIRRMIFAKAVHEQVTSSSESDVS